MESLPPEMVAEVAQYLTVSELGACSAVSRRWRQQFNTDLVWKPHYNPTTAEYLRSTPGVVEPTFKPPKLENTTLDSLCQGRLAYMRESHLTRNWNNGHHVVEKLPNAHKIRFLRNDLIICTRNISFPRDHIMKVYDVRSIPSCLIAEIEFDIQDVFYNFHVVNDHVITLVERKRLQIFSLNLSVKLLCLIHMIKLDQQAISLMIPPNIKVKAGSLGCDTIIKKWISDDTYSFYFGDDYDDQFPYNYDDEDYDFEKEYTVLEKSAYAIVGTQFIVVSGEQLHVWELQSGEKLKTEVVPYSDPHTYSGIAHSKTCSNVAIIVEKGNLFVYGIFNAKDHYFLNFQESHFSHFTPACSINKNFLSIFCEKSFKIYNYVLEELMFKINVENFYFGSYVINDKFAFVFDGKLQLFVVSNNKIKQTALFKGFSRFNVMNDQVILLDYSCWNVSNLLKEFKCTQIDQVYKINDSCTILLSTTSQLVHFW